MNICNSYFLHQGIYSRNILSRPTTVEFSKIGLSLLAGFRNYHNYCTTEFEKRGLPVSLKPEFYVPRSERTNYNLYNMHYHFGEERLARSVRSDPTRELNFTAAHWKKHKSPFRKWRHILNTFRGSVFQRLLLPELFVSGFISVSLTYYNVLAPTIGVTESCLNMDGYGAGTTAIEVLAAYCLNTNYRRYEHCRLFWAETLSSSRDLATNVMMWMNNKSQQIRMLKLLKAYPVCYNFHVNQKGSHHNMREIDKSQNTFEDRIQAEFQAELLDIYSDGTHDDDFRRLCRVKYKGGNASLEALTVMRETVAASVGHVDAIYVREMDKQIQRLSASYGSSERILQTPLPTSFTRHTSRVILIWCCVLPFFLYPSMGPYLTLPASLLTTYAVLGIEDVATQIEEPFNVMPLRQYSDEIFDSVTQIENNYRTYVTTGKALEKNQTGVIL